VGIPYPPTLLIKVQKETQQEEIRQIYSPFGEISDLKVENCENLLLVSLTFAKKIGNSSRKAMTKVNSQKFVKLLDMEFDLDGRLD
jgi:hypothetical protein